MQKNILIIGSSSRIGREVIKLSASQGDNIYATSRSPIDISVKQFFQLDPNEDLSELDSLPCLLYTSPSPRDMRRSRMPSSA